MFALGGHFRSAYESIRAQLRRQHLELSAAQGVAELLAGGVALLVAAACLAWMAWRAMSGEVTLGDLALFYQAFTLGQRLLRSLLGNMGQIYYNVLFLGNLFEFLDLEGRVVDPLQPRPAPAASEWNAGLEIRFRNVTFSYPGSGRPALEHLDLDIPAGRTIAIVGANGAGKSTLLKLLCRFYDPQEGKVEVGRIDVRELSLRDLRGLATVLFQQPVHYNASVAENIALGNRGASATSEDIEAAARAAGAHEVIVELPNGYETHLGRWFAGGVELSIGEWQRIALAHALLRRASILVLDDPTSAMDSLAEAHWLRRVAALSSGRTTIIVTHRFTTAMRADLIYVMHRGRIVESGSHDELLAKNGSYAKSWRAPAWAAAPPGPPRCS